MMALIEDGEAESAERVDRPVSGRNCLNHADRTIVFKRFWRGFYRAETSQQLRTRSTDFEPVRPQTLLEFGHGKLLRCSEPRLHFALLNHTDADARNRTLQLFAPLFHKKLLMNDDEEPFAKLTCQPDRHECLAVAAGYTDQTIVSTVFKSLHDGQLFGTQCFVKLEFGTEGAAVAAGITIRWTVIVETPEARYIPSTRALEEYWKGIDARREFSGNTGHHRQRLTKLACLSRGQRVFANRVSPVAEDTGITHGILNGLDH